MELTAQDSHYTVCMNRINQDPSISGGIFDLLASYWKVPQKLKADLVAL
jgi:hypothetical protein